VELSFRDEYLARADMWRLAVSELANKSVYRGQKIMFMGTIKASVKDIFVQGRRVRSAYFSASTKPIFRSESARYIIFIQMSKEMWDFDAQGTGEIMFNKVINGFLPELFKRWEDIGARHLVSIVLFTRMEYDSDVATAMLRSPLGTNSSRLQDHHKAPSSKDYYRVVVSDMASGQWTSILLQLKKEFKVFLRDVSVVRAPARADPASAVEKTQQASLERSERVITGSPSVAVRGNILEAITLACSQFLYDHIDRDLVRTGVSVVVVTPGTGVFEVDHNLLALATETVTGNGVGIDLVCLSPMPLHSVPLFRHRQRVKVSEPKASSAKVATSDNGAPHVTNPAYNSYCNSIPTILPSPTPPSGFTPSSVYNPSEPTAVGERWNYAIPHWIDVSFWTAQEHGYSNRRNNLKGFHSRLGLDGTFEPRVRMYELQMMGVMENEMTNISIPYLHEYLSYPKHLLNPYLELEQFKLALNSTERCSTKSKQLSQSTKDALQWMEKYDEAVFHPRIRKQEAEIQPAFRNRRDDRNLARSRTRDGTYVLGTSIEDPDGTLRGSALPSSAAYLDQKMKGRERSAEQAPSRKSSAGKSAATLKPPMAGPRRLSRQISFGFRGIGTIAPKATASTGITSEYARSRLSVARGFLTASSTPSASVALSSQTTTTPLEQASVASTRNGSDSGSTSSSIPKTVTSDAADTQPSRPIAIKVAMRQRLTAQGSTAKQQTDMISASELAKHQAEELDASYAGVTSETTGPQRVSTKIINGSVEPLTSSLLHTRAHSPWLTILNPSNPGREDINLAAHLGRWQHVFPRRLRTSGVRWKSLCSPAAMPLTTECFPSGDELASNYQESPYRIARNDDDELAEVPKSMEGCLRELVAFRLSRGFQILVGANVAQVIGQSAPQSGHVLSDNFIREDATNVYLAKGSTIHQILCTDGNEVEIKRYIRKANIVGVSSEVGTSPLPYKPAIRTILAEDYTDRDIVFHPVKEEDNWNYVDNFIAGYREEFTDQLRFWRARFVLIPVEPSSTVRRPLQSLNEDNEEEIRLEGIRKLTQMWQRYRYVPPQERRFPAPARKRKDTNPLDIMYQTRNPSVVVAAELDSSLLAEGETGPKSTQLLPDSDLFQRSTVNLSTLAQTIQGEKGVRMMDRRWHWRLHYNCFIGFDLTSWLLQNFRDVDTREEAVELGNNLMKNGLFQHVEKRHNFRDGNFFYQIASEYRNPRPESRSGWFGTRKEPLSYTRAEGPSEEAEKSVPSMPMSETVPKYSPNPDRPGSTSRVEDGQSVHDIATPTVVPPKILEVALSKVMRYGVDHRKKSYRPEFINLHYDRLHNPDNCYHIRIDWMTVTSKLIEDAIVSWATTAEKYGLRLVEVPIGEASSISDTHPFRAPYTVKLAAQPPENQPQAYFDATSFSTQGRKDRHVYQKAIMKRFNFVLDLEAAKDFPEDVNVHYSWGKPDYRFPQYIHRSGVLLAQITDKGDFLLLANRLYNTRSAATKDTAKNEKTDYGRRAGPGPGPAAIDRLSPFSSPLIRATPDVLGGALAHSEISSGYTTPEKIQVDFERFCSDAGTLQRFYDEVLTKSVSPGPNTPFLDTTIPSIGLPPSLNIRGASLSQQVEAIADTAPKQDGG